MRQLSLLWYDYVPDIMDRRGPYREGHLGLLTRMHEAGECIMAGALGDPPHAGVLVFRDAQATQRFVDQDPYISAGLVTGHRIEPWTVPVG
ncbi:MAG: hypothetical protein CSA58_07875 [Micrococcales bacterium]|nr:MAG: hypothetical protein CSB46_03820 [Micrococcales bacterium]PIE26796.1 MAG: hypothetical protein CSA58_07875 [Micrococcales bacterium]